MSQAQQASSTSAADAGNAKKKGGCCGGGGGGNSAQQTGRGTAVRMAGQNGARSSSAGRGTERSRRARGGGMIEAKIILLGDSAVGKSSIALRFCQDRFDEVHDVTIGGAYLQKIISIQNPDNPTGPEQQVKMHIWDTGGHERFRSMINMYYRDAIGAIICYDLTSEHSFKSVEYWVNEMKLNTTADQDGFIMALAGNKCDLPIEQQRVDHQRSIDFARDNQMIWSEVSAKMGTGIESMFKKVAEKVCAIKGNAGGRQGGASGF